MPTLQQTVDEATKVLAQTKAQGTKPFKGSSFDTPIPYSTLTSKDTPADVATPPVPTQAEGLGAGIETMANQNKDSYTKNLANNAETAKTNADSSFEEYMKSVLGTEGKTSLTDKAYKGTVDPAQAELNDINNQIIAEQVAVRRRVEKAQKENPLGKSAEGIQDQVDQINRESISKQADLAVIQLSKQGKYDSAIAIADRAVSAQFEQQQLKNEALKLNYERNKDLFTTAEQRAFETAQADRERNLEFEMYKEKKRFDQAIEQNDPLRKLQIKEAEIKLAALENPDPNGLSTETLERITKLPPTSQEKLVNANDTIDQLSRLKTLIAENDAVTLSNPLTEQGRLFQRLATDVADKMARERTGAVVTAEEQGNFKKILGLSFGNRLLEDDAILTSELDKFITKHSQTRKLIDPTGEITAYLGQVPIEDSYVNSLEGFLGGESSSIESYLAQFETSK